MAFEMEIERLRKLEYYSNRELKIRKDIIDSIKDTNHTNLWGNYDNYLTEQRITMNCNQEAIELTKNICKKIEPPGCYMMGYKK